MNFAWTWISAPSPLPLLSSASHPRFRFPPRMNFAWTWISAPSPFFSLKETHPQNHLASSLISFWDCRDPHPQSPKTLPSFSSGPSCSHSPSPHPCSTFSSGKSRPPFASTSLFPLHLSFELRPSSAFPPPSPSLSASAPSRPLFPALSSSFPLSPGRRHRLSFFSPCCQAVSYPPCSCSSS